jgi:protease-4
MSTRTKSEKFFTFLKNFFIVLLVLQFLPSVISNLRSNLEEAMSSKVHVGYLKIKGVIADSAFYNKKIDEFSKDPEIKGLILKIDSPGGLPGSAQAIFNELKRFKKNKPIVVITENMCASAAYYIAASGNKIICAPSSLVGSIGTVMQLPNVKDLLENWRVKVDYVQSGSYKTAGSPVKKMSPAEHEYLQALADDSYQQFVNDVATSRGLSLKKSKLWADGKIFTGTQALKLNLVDSTGSIQDAIDAMKALLKTKEDLKLVQPEIGGSPLMKLLVGSDDEYTAESSCGTEVAASFLNAVYSKFLAKQTTSSNVATLS